MTTTSIIPQWDLGDRLRKAREHAGIRSHAEMAERLSERGIVVGRTTISNWETGATRPGRKDHPIEDVIDAWSDVTGVDREWLMWAARESNPEPTGSGRQQLAA